MEVRFTTNYDDKLIQDICAIINSAWPSELNEDQQVDKFKKNYLVRPHRCSFVIEENNKVVAHSGLFSRTITTQKGPLEIAGLIAVCVLPECKGKGYGKAVVQEAFSGKHYNFSNIFLFQTSLNEFYEKLDCRMITNDFINSQDLSKKPWWDKFIMIHPGDYHWPKGQIDLNGPGY